MFQSVLPFETAITAKEQTATQRREIKKMLLRTMGQEINLSTHQCKIKKEPNSEQKINLQNSMMTANPVQYQMCGQNITTHH